MSNEALYNSYSIEAEDLIVSSIIYNVANVAKKYDPGFYIDIGAHHPRRYSNTFLLYKSGWRGVCVEPNPEFELLYKQERPRDTLINAGISGTAGTLRYHRFDESLENGFFDDNHIAGRIKDGRKYLGHQDIPCLGAKDFLKQEIKEKVDYLNLDVEGKEVEILSAWDWSSCRPTVICAEIHTRDIESMLKSPVAMLLAKVGYVAISRGLISSMFVVNESLPPCTNGQAF